MDAGGQCIEDTQQNCVGPAPVNFAAMSVCAVNPCLRRVQYSSSVQNFQRNLPVVHVFYMAELAKKSVARRSNVFAQKTITVTSVSTKASSPSTLTVPLMAVCEDWGYPSKIVLA